MSGISNMLTVAINVLDCDSVCAFFLQLAFFVFSTLCRVLGVIADLLHVAFYIFAGVDFKHNAKGENVYAIDVLGEKKNILDYFVFNETVRNAYFWLAIIGLVLIVAFTIYKVVKQDYFDKAGPRSKGPIFRNVAISCISFLLVLPIFYLIIHVSSLLTIAVIEALGMDSATFAGATVFKLSWSNGGELMNVVNTALRKNSNFQWMMDLDNDTLFTMMADLKYVKYDSNIMEKLGDISAESGTLVGKTKSGAEITSEFYWWIYLIGIVVAIRALYTLLMAMIQRLFKLMALFIVAPAPISQYVLDDGAKYKEWLEQSIQEGLRLVTASMSFGIYLLVLNLVQDINFIPAFKSAVDNSQASLNISTSLLNDTTAQQPADWVNGANDILNGGVGIVSLGASIVGNTASSWFEVLSPLIHSFLQVIVLIAAGGAIKDLDTVLTSLVSGAKNSLDAGATGGAASQFLQSSASVGAASVGAMIGSFQSSFENKGKKYKAINDGIHAEEDDASRALSDALNNSFSPAANIGGAPGTSGPTFGNQSKDVGASMQLSNNANSSSGNGASLISQGEANASVQQPELQYSDNEDENTTATPQEIIDDSNTENSGAPISMHMDDGKPTKDKNQNSLLLRAGKAISSAFNTVRSGTINAIENAKLAGHKFKNSIVGKIIGLPAQTAVWAYRTYDETLGQGKKAVAKAVMSEVAMNVSGADLVSQFRGARNEVTNRMRIKNLTSKSEFLRNSTSINSTTIAHDNNNDSMLQSADVFEYTGVNYSEKNGSVSVQTVNPNSIRNEDDSEFEPNVNYVVEDGENESDVEENQFNANEPSKDESLDVVGETTENAEVENVEQDSRLEDDKEYTTFDETMDLFEEMSDVATEQFNDDTKRFELNMYQGFQNLSPIANPKEEIYTKGFVDGCINGDFNSPPAKKFKSRLSLLESRAQKTAKIVCKNNFMNKANKDQKSGNLNLDQIEKLNNCDSYEAILEMVNGNDFWNLNNKTKLNEEGKAKTNKTQDYINKFRSSAKSHFSLDGEEFNKTKKEIFDKNLEKTNTIGGQREYLESILEAYSTVDEHGNKTYDFSDGNLQKELKEFGASEEILKAAKDYKQDINKYENAMNVSEEGARNCKDLKQDLDEWKQEQFDELKDYKKQLLVEDLVNKPLGGLIYGVGAMPGVVVAGSAIGIAGGLSVTALGVAIGVAYALSPPILATTAYLAGAGVVSAVPAIAGTKLMEKGEELMDSSRGVLHKAKTASKECADKTDNLANTILDWLKRYTDRCDDNSNDRTNKFKNKIDNMKNTEQASFDYNKVEGNGIEDALGMTMAKQQANSIDTIETILENIKTPVNNIDLFTSNTEKMLKEQQEKED